MELLGKDLINVDDLVELLLRLAINTVVILILVRYLYYSTTRRKDYLFTYFLSSAIVFLLCYSLENVKLELGFALGLFAIFGIIRYRTRQIAIKEMTYLFLVIGVSVINALSNNKVSYAELLLINLVFIVITYLLERVFLLEHETRKNIDYEKIELIKPENYNLLLRDLEKRTGLRINRVVVGRIDLTKDIAHLHIYYYEKRRNMNVEDEYQESEQSF